MYKHLYTTCLLFWVSTFAIMAQEKPNVEWVKAEVAKLIKDPNTNLMFRELYGTVADVSFYEGEYNMAFEESLLAVCEPGDSRAFQFYEGMPVYLLLRLDYNDDGQWEVGWYKNWYEVIDVADKTGDGITDAIGLSSRCKKGKCDFKHLILSLKGNSASELLRLDGWDYTGMEDKTNAQIGDTLRYMRELKFIDLNKDGINEIFVETELAILAEEGDYAEFYELVPYRLRTGKGYIAADKTSYPKFIKQFFMDFEAAVRSRNKAKVMTFFHPQYVKEQHDEFLEGRTDQFIKEFFCGNSDDKERKFTCFGLNEIEKLERLSIEEENGHYLGVYLIYGKGKRVVLSVGAVMIDEEGLKYGFWGAAG